jgi:uncharacterized protein (TIRG00374 family)
VNFVFPARVGDLIRGVALNATDDVPVGAATGLVAVERVLDMLVIGTGLSLVGWFVFPNGDVQLLAAGAFAIAALVGLVLGGIHIFDDVLHSTVGGRFPRLDSFIETFNRALRRVVQKQVSVLLALMLTVPVWFFEVTTLFFSARAVGLNLSVIETVTVSLTAFIAQAVPLTPAGIGTYEVTIASVLGLFGVGTDAGTAMALIDHFVRLLLVYLLGAVSVIHIGFRSRTFFRKKRLETDTDAPNEPDV